MSGHKRATVALNPDDFRRLHEAESRLRTVEQDYQDIRQRVSSLHTQTFRQVEERQERFQSALQEVDADLSALEWNTSQALLAHLEQVQSQVGVLSEQAVQDASALVDASSQRFEEGLEQIAREHQGQLERLQRGLRKLHRSAQGRAELAAQALASAQALLEAVHSTYGLSPEAALLAQDLANAQSNFDHALYEAALLGAQQAAARLSDLRLRLEQAILQRQALLSQLLDQARSLAERGRRSRLVPALDLDGQPLDFAVDLPFWSGGAFQVWASRCQKLLRQLEAHGEQLDLPELEQLQQQALPELEQSLSEIVYQARLSVIASQVRFNIAACIVQALQEQGFELSAAAYDASDQRLAYQATVTAFDGSEVVVHVNPVPGDPAMTDIDLLSSDRELRSEHELRSRARELASSLQAFGLQVGQLSVPLQPQQALRERRAAYSTQPDMDEQAASAGNRLPARRPAPLRKQQRSQSQP